MLGSKCSRTCLLSPKNLPPSRHTLLACLPVRLSPSSSRFLSFITSRSLSFLPFHFISFSFSLCLSLAAIFTSYVTPPPLCGTLTGFSTLFLSHPPNSSLVFFSPFFPSRSLFLSLSRSHVLFHLPCFDPPPFPHTHTHTHTLTHSHPLCLSLTL